MICFKKTRLTPWDPKGYRNYNQGGFSQIELIWCSVDWKAPELCTISRLTSAVGIGLLLQRSCWCTMETPTKRITFKLFIVSVLRSTQKQTDAADPCMSATHAHTDSNCRGCAARAPPPRSLQVKSPIRKGHDSAFGFSARPLAHLWGPWGSLASSTSLISTCQPASCCVWIQGMSGATSRSHSKWRDESEGQELAYGPD